MNETDIAQANKWHADARAILEKANGLLSDSNGTFNTVIDEVNQILGSNRYQFLIDSISQQLRLLDLILNSLTALNETFHKEFNEEVRENSAVHLDSILEELQRIKTTAGRTLHDFVNHEELNNTKVTYVQLMKQINMEKSQLDLQYLTDALSEFQKTFSSIIDKDFILLITDQLDPFITNNAELEHEMAGLLESLTKHYEQTRKAIDFFSETNSGSGGGGSSIAKTELYQVLQNDSEELPVVVEDLEEINEHFKQNCNQIAENLQIYKAEESQLIKFLKTLKTFSSNLSNEFIVRYNHSYNNLVDKFNDFSIANENLIEFAKYYNNFIASFENLTTELKRRRAVNKELTKLVIDFKSKAEDISNRDKAERERFLTENGEYLPKNILDDDDSNWSNILYNQLPEVELIYHSEQIPKV